ncbi:MAG: hypothetical protein U0Y08_10370 [Bacteroidia bacterium]
MKNLLWILAGLLSLTFVSCEQNDLLLSEKKLDEKIQTSWKVLYANSNDSHETWSFGDGTVSIHLQKYYQNGTLVMDTVLTGDYSIDARFSKAYVKLSDFSFADSTIGVTNSGFRAADLNRAWTIVMLDDKVLYLSATDNAGAIRSIEFIKQ